MALAGIEHGIGEISQGNRAPDGIMILSWPDAGFFRSLGGEPAMTVIPNLLVTGILAVLVSLALLVWTVLFAHRKNGGLVMILLSIPMLLVGGGIFPPILTIMIGVVATRIHSPLAWWRVHLPDGLRRFLAKLWPCSYAACLVAWPALLPGIGLLEYYFGVDDPLLILVMILFALGTLPLAAVSGFAHDIQASVGMQSSSQDTRREGRRSPGILSIR